MEVRPVSEEIIQEINIWTEYLIWILEFVFTIIKGCCLRYFLGSFLEERFAKQRWSGFVFVFIYALLWKGFDWISPVPDYGDAGRESLNVIIRILFAFCLVSWMSMIFYKAHRLVRLFLDISFLAVSEITFQGIYALWFKASHMLSAWELLLYEEGRITSEGFIGWMTVTYDVTLCILYAVSLTALYLSLKNIVRNFREKDYVIHRTELLFLLTPELAGLLICMLLRIIMVVMENEIATFLYDRYPLLLLIVPAILLFSLLSVLYGIKLFQDMISFNREKSDRVILENQISNMQSHMEEMEHVYAGVRSMKHDMKNTLSVIMHLSSERNEEKDGELESYLAELNRSFEELEFRFRTGNLVVDTLLNMKYHEINKQMPELAMDADKLLFPDSLQIHSYDIGVILGNALDNAIEACRKKCEKDKDAEVFIRLLSFQKGKMFFLEIENSYDGKIIRRPQEEFPQTDKADKCGHGIGLANIKNAAEKYHGAVDWSADGEVFTLSVMMKNEKGMENYV